MDTLKGYRQIVRDVLTPYTHIAYTNVDVRDLANFDVDHDQ